MRTKYILIATIGILTILAVSFLILGTSSENQNIWADAVRKEIKDVTGQTVKKEIAVTVFDSQGGAVEGAVVSIGGSCTTSSFGKCAIKDVGPGDYFVSIKDKNLGQMQVLDLDENPISTLTVKDDQTKTIEKLFVVR